MRKVNNGMWVGFHVMFLPGCSRQSDIHLSFASKMSNFFIVLFHIGMTTDGQMKTGTMLKLFR